MIEIIYDHTVFIIPMNDWPTVLMVWIVLVVMLKLITDYLFGWFQTTKTGSQLYSDNSPDEVSEICKITIIKFWSLSKYCRWNRFWSKRTWWGPRKSLWMPWKQKTKLHLRANIFNFTALVVAQLVERSLPKPEVCGSNPVIYFILNIVLLSRVCCQVKSKIKKRRGPEWAI